MDNSKAINIAIGCVTGSYLETKDKREVIDTLRDIERKIERNEEENSNSR